MNREERQILKLSGIYTVIALALIALFWMPFALAQTQTGYCPYDPKIVPPKHLGEFSRVFRTLIVEVGSDSTFYIPVGTTSVTGSGTAGRVGTDTARDLSLPMFGWNGSAWVFKPAGSTSAWQTVGSLTPGSMSAYIQNVSGTSTGLTGTNTTLNGTTTIDASGVVIAGGRSLSPTEVSYLDGLSDYLTTLLAAKQNDLSGNYVASLSDDVGTVTGSVRIKGSGDIGVTISGNLVSINLAGTPTAKADVRYNGGNVVIGASFLDFLNNFVVGTSGAGVSIDLTPQIIGTTSASADYNVKLDGTGKVSKSQIPMDLSGLGSLNIDGINGSSSCFGSLHRTTSYEIAANNKWYNLGLDGTSTAKNVTYGTATITVLVPGTYQISYHIPFRDCVMGIARVIKNWSTEVKGSSAYGNTSNVAWISVGVPSIITSLVANDTIGVQVGCESPTGSPEIDFVGSANLPDPTTNIYGILSVVKIGE